MKKISFTQAYKAIIRRKLVDAIGEERSL